MRRRLRNITITLERLLAPGRVQAAINDSSVSRFQAEILKEGMIESDGYDTAKRRALARKPFLKSDGRYFTREEVHDRARLR
ncbi:MAG TPA: hypothetical protein VNB49_00120 [Candidatus Dormibacteraeota bacterium]|nr:hypothetical protein [Candidatus Dormibacteraeota bacterium]